MFVRAVDDKPSDTLVVVSGEGFWTGSSTLPHLHQHALVHAVSASAGATLAVAAVLFAIAAGVVVVTLHLRRTAVDPVTDGVSGYALTPLAILYRVQVVATGLAASFLAVALGAGGLVPPIELIPLLLFAASRLLIARYPTDPRGTTTFSRSGRIHVILAAATFLTIAIAAPSISGTLTGRAAWSGPTGPFMGLAWATTVLAFATFSVNTIPTTRRVFGIVERGAYVAMLAWLACSGVAVAAWT